MLILDFIIFSRSNFNDSEFKLLNIPVPCLINIAHKKKAKNNIIIESSEVEITFNVERWI